MAPEFTEILRILTAVALAMLAFATAVDRHLVVVAYLGRSAYTTLSLILRGLTFGRVRMKPLARTAKARQMRRWRAVQFWWEERQLATGEVEEGAPTAIAWESARPAALPSSSSASESSLGIAGLGTDMDDGSAAPRALRPFSQRRADNLATESVPGDATELPSQDPFALPPPRSSKDELA